MGETETNLRDNAAGLGERTGANVPPLREQRERLRDVARRHVRRAHLVPPVGLDELAGHCRAILREAGLDGRFLGYAAVLAHNELWRESFAGVPHQKRLLLLPKCLRDAARCGGRIDALGLLCARCGACEIASIQDVAEKLGYVVLVAEGVPVVVSLLGSGKIEGILGVGCLDSLEKVFPLVSSSGVPAVAVPLLRDGCEDTAADTDWIYELICLDGGRRSRLVNVDRLRRQAAEWFTPPAAAELLGSAADPTSRIAREWLVADGKRWRPLLVACSYEAFAGPSDGALCEDVRRAAVAVECFHKASLIHDDIEDGDAVRYGRRTLHEQHGVAVALNVGDLLIGEGYRLLARCSCGAEARAEMLRSAAEAHRRLCLGQGADLCWSRSPVPLTVEQVLDIYVGKTAPAFELALRVGAILAGADDRALACLTRYSSELGIAYQIGDDLEDMEADAGNKVSARPSVLPALALRRADEGQRRVLTALWRADADTATRREARGLLARLGAADEARAMLDAHRRAALASIETLGPPAAAALLRSVLVRILDGFRTSAAERAVR